MRRIACEVCPDRNGSLICDLPADVLRDFRAAGTPLLCRPRQIIFSEGMPATSLYLLCHGAVKLCNTDRFGREHILAVAGPGTLLGEISHTPEAVLSCTAEVLTESQVLCLPRERLAAFIERHPETAMRFVAALSRELAVARHKVRDLALKSAESRLAGLLLQLADAAAAGGRPGRRLHLTYRRQELAEMIGVSTETAIRMLSALKRKGAIATDGRDVVIIDAERLARIAQHEDAAPAPRTAKRTDVAQSNS